MAYAATPTIVRQGNKIFVTIAETDAGAATDVVALDIAVDKFRVFRQKCQMVSGTGVPGATVDPLLIRNATDITGNAVELENDAPGAIIDNATPGDDCKTGASGIIYHRSVSSDTNADHVINTEYVFLVGWGA